MIYYELTVGLLFLNGLTAIFSISFTFFLPLVSQYYNTDTLGRYLVDRKEVIHFCFYPYTKMCIQLRLLGGPILEFSENKSHAYYSGGIPYLDSVHEFNRDVHVSVIRKPCQLFDALFSR